MERDQPMHAAVLTVSDRCAAGEQEDVAGPMLAAILQERLGVELRRALVPDEIEPIREQLARWADEEGVVLILTTGGTGFAPRDRTPEAVAPLIERPAPGLVVAMLNAGLAVTPYAMLSRPVAGLRGGTLIVTLPGSPRGARQGLQALLPALPHGLALLRERRGEAGRHTPPRAL